jgi:hypothetical protein
MFITEGITLQWKEIEEPADRSLGMRMQAYILSVPDPEDYEGPLTRWVFPTEENYFVKDLLYRLGVKPARCDAPLHRLASGCLRHYAQAQ